MKILPKWKKLGGWLIILFSFFVLTTESANDVSTLVAPKRYASNPGEGSEAPFLVPGSRYQNVYTASEFKDALPEGGIITALAFRIDESDRGSFSAVIPDIEIHMSTWPSGRLSEVFSENVGPDETTVFPRGSIQFSGSPSTVSPKPFNLRFPLATPFYYDPRAGGLTVDIFVYEGSTGRLLVDSGGFETTARVGPIGVSSWPVGSSGLVLQLEYTTVAEPCFTSLALICAFAAIWRRQS